VVQQPITPLLVQIAEPATEEISVADVLLGVLGLTGWMLFGAVVLALVFAGVLIGLRRFSPLNPLNGDETNPTRLGLHLPSG